MDRISRSLSDFVNILAVFKKYGVEFVSTQEAFDTGSPYGELMIKIKEVQNTEIDFKTGINLSKKWKYASFEEKQGVCQILINQIIKMIKINFIPLRKQNLHHFFIVFIF